MSGKNKNDLEIAYKEEMGIEKTVTEAIKNESENLTPGEIFTKWERLRLTTDKPIEAPEVIISAYDIAVGTPGNIVTISGPSKTGKSAVGSLLLSECIKTSNGIDGCKYITVANNTALKAVIHIDTEQSNYHQYRNLKNAILKRAHLEKEPPNFLSYNYRSLSLTNYIQATEELFRAAFQQFGGIHLAVIDGVADFISSVNDEAEANGIISFFERLSIKYDTVILLMLHLNPGSDKERGHLGSQLQRKSESLLTIKREGEMSVLEAKLLRCGGSLDFAPINYRFDKEKHYHVFIESGETSKNSILLQLAGKVFTKERTYTEAVELIAEFEGKTDRTAKTRMSKLTELGIIARDEKSAMYFLMKKESEYVPP